MFNHKYNLSQFGIPGIHPCLDIIGQLDGARNESALAPPKAVSQISDPLRVLAAMTREASVRVDPLGSRHVRTLHPKLHVARTGRALSADPTGGQLAAPLQYRPDDGDRCREIGRCWSRAYSDALGSRGFLARAAIASPHVLRLAGMLQRHCVEPVQELVDIDKFLVSVRS